MVPAQRSRPDKTVIKTLLAQKRTDDALTLLNGMVDVEDCPHWAIKLLVDELVRSGRVDDAIRVLQHALHRARQEASTVVPGLPATRPVTLRSLLVRLLADQRRVDELRVLARDRVPGGDEVLATAFADLGCWSDALELARLGEEWSARWTAARLAHAGQVDRLRELAVLARASVGVALAEALLELDRDAEALKELDDLRSTFDELAPSGRLLELLVEHGHVDVAIDWIRFSMEAMANLLDTFLASLVRHGYDDQARWFLRDVLDTATEPSWATRTVRLAVEEALADRLAAAGQWAEVIELLRSAGNWKNDWLPGQLAKSGNIARLRALAELGNERACTEFVRLTVDDGKTDAALELLRVLAAADYEFAKAQLARLLAECGRVRELRSRTAAGDTWCAQWLLSLAVNQKLPDPDDLLRYGLTTDGTMAACP